MEVCVFYKPESNPHGGANQFLRSLTEELARLGHSVVSTPTPDTEIVLLNSWSSGPNRYIRPSQVAQIRATGSISRIGGFIPRWLYSTRRKRTPMLVHRVDGVDAVMRGYRSKRDRIQLAVNRLADLTIFQSSYSQSSFDEHLGHRTVAHDVIPNGVDAKIFYPRVDQGRRRARTLKLVAVSWSTNPQKGFSTLSEASGLPGVELVFVGNWCPDVDPGKARIVGPLAPAEVAEEMRNADALLHAGWHEACSNAIVEALACGLPIIYRDSGGNAELASGYGVPLGDSLMRTIDSLREGYQLFRRRVQENRRSFLIQTSTQAYIQAFERVRTHRALMKEEQC